MATLVTGYCWRDLMMTAMVEEVVVEKADIVISLKLRHPHMHCL